MSAGVSALRGPAPALRRATPDERRPMRVLRPSGPQLPFAFARGSTFLALATFGALHWMAMLEPSAGTRAWYAVGTAALAMGGLLGAARLSGAPRWRAVAAVSLGALALAFLAAGTADELLRPDNWDELAAGITRGIDALPGARVPYRGIDAWTRLVIPLGGTILTVAAALLAFWPRRGRVGTQSTSSTGFPLVALIALVTLYAVPAVALDFTGEFLRGALLTLLVLAFMRLERLRLTEAGGAAALAAGTAIAALIIAPALDRDAPWWDYETWALSTAASHSTSFSWDHDYGPLNWPRDGREMLRVKAKQPAYWKAESLDVFDGRVWRQARSGTREATIYALPADPAVRERWTQPIKVNVRNLRTRTFVTAGIAVDAPEMPHRAAIPNGPQGIWSSSRTLRRGDTYTANVYTPRPTERELAAAGTHYDRDFSPYLEIGLAERTPVPAGSPVSPTTVDFPQWADGTSLVRAKRPDPATGGLEFIDGDKALAASGLRRTWALAQRLRSGASNPFEYTKAIEAYLSRGFSYTESPPAAARTLDGFLFDAKSGYCQQYSGSMALLLRMEGIPARIATGFTAGSLDRKAREYVVRDLDAHSWVEAWFPGIGWVTFDPTPAAAPPRSQSDDPKGNAAIGDAPQFGGGGALDPRSRSAATDGTNWGLIAGGGFVALLLLALGGLAFRRRGRGDAPLPELERALQRTRRAPGPGATLQGLEDAFARSPEAVGYVRALREQRYGGRGGEPTPAQRRGLRSELGRGGGLIGRLRAWWALPPRASMPSAGRRTLDAHG
ncbi:MAG: transglutaminaseTgpA domain-containing protein [Solirubrobacteraceae bacterium]